jgi:hypothetical protein
MNTCIIQVAKTLGYLKLIPGYLDKLYQKLLVERFQNKH